METKEWSDEFKLGIEVIDEDHQMLFRTIGQLGKQISENRNAGVIEATIKSLGLYVEEHFDREERFMLRAGYPDFDAHKKQHDDFRDSIISLRDFHARCPQDVDAVKIVNFLENWLLTHIAKVDCAYSPYLLGQKKGDPAVMQRQGRRASKATVNIVCPADKEEQVRHFISLLSDVSEEGKLIEAAVEKITDTQSKRREIKAQKLFGR